MSEASAKRSVQSVVEDAQRIAQRASATARKDESEQFSSLVQQNPIAKIMLNSELSPEAKRDELVKALSFSKTATKEENRAKIEAFNQFKEYLQEQRKILNKEGIKLQDTEAFAELQSVIDDMTKSSLHFQEKIQPLMDILTAVFEIRKQNKIVDVYQEIESDRAWQEQQQKELAKLESDLKGHKALMDHLGRDQIRLKADRSLFGFGPVKHESLVRANEIQQIELPKLSQAITDVVAKLEEKRKILAAGPGSDNPELVRQKNILREFLDLTQDANRERQRSLIDAAVTYVETSDERLKSVLSTLDRLGKHAGVMSDANGTLRHMHVIMDESIKDVTKTHESLKGELVKESSGESAIAKMSREEKLNDLNEHITLTNEGGVDIANSIGGLTKHSVQIQAYKDTVRNETGSTKRLHLEGVSQMGEQLMSVLSAISAAATSESRSIAANNFARMAEQNQAIISQEVVKNATNVEFEAGQIARLVGELQDYGDVLKASSEIASQGYGRMRETVDAIRKVSGHVQDAIKDLVSDRADAGMSDSTKTKEQTAEQTKSNPFAKIRSS